MENIRKKLKEISKDPVLLVAFAVAVLSMAFVPPSRKYFNYIDFHVLSLLFTMMLVVGGLQKAGVFGCIVDFLLKFVHNTRVLAFVLIGVCFFCSMLITNDVALITFVPLGMMALAQTKQQKLLIPIVILQTVAANLGSMFTPLGNPQNLYLYSVSEMTMMQFMGIMAMPSMISFILLSICLLFIQSEEIQPSTEIKSKTEWRKLMPWCAMFLVCLFSVLRLIPYGIALVAVIAGVITFDRKILFSVDYGLLLTFVLLFIFIGNMKSISAISNTLSALVGGREIVAGILLSQIISNVPAAMLLSKFTINYSALLIGVNLGGLGTLIASMASVISYKLYASASDAQTGKYLVAFTGVNIFFLVILCGTMALFAGI